MYNCATCGKRCPNDYKCPDCAESVPLVRSSEIVGRDGQKPKINPEYLKASHRILWMYPGAPSFEEQIRHDQEVQEQLEKEMREASNNETL